MNFHKQRGGEIPFGTKRKIVSEWANTANGKDDPPLRASKEPFSHLSRNPQTPGGRLLRAVKREEEGAYEDLMAFTVPQIQKLSKVKSERHKEERFAKLLFVIASWKSLHGESYPKERAAKELGCSSSHYSNAYAPMINLIHETFFMRWARESNPANP